MYFDPLSAWLVTLIADGIFAVGDFAQSGTVAEYHQKSIMQSNNKLNADIRRIKGKYGLSFAERAYEQIQAHIRVARKSVSRHSANGQIVIDLDNQEYIIAVLEECGERFSQHESERLRQKAAWYKNAAYEARRKKEIYAKEAEEARIRKAAQRENDQAMSNIYLIVGLIIGAAFLLFFFS